MRSNLPVTQNEYVLRQGMTIVSRTDLKGRITYINDDFIEASGFTQEELIGQPHNLVRHPDMPEEAFDDMWRTLKAGLPWTGLVKNRCKNGDHYWVVANATPVREGDAVSTGLLSQLNLARRLLGGAGLGTKFALLGITGVAAAAAAAAAAWQGAWPVAVGAAALGGLGPVSGARLARRLP